MAHFAKLGVGDIVTEVHVVRNEVITDNNGNFRKNYAGIGFKYDRTRDAFIPPKPFDSWTLNEETCQWEAPVAYPEDGKNYIWNETTQQWDLNE